MTDRSQSPISFRVHVNRLPARGMPVEIVADADQRRALADAHGLLSLEELRAELLVQRWKADGVRVSGRVHAHLTQACVVTLEPVSELVDEPVSALFVPEGSRLARAGEGGEVLLDAEGPDPPETFTGDAIDVGAVAEEFFALGIDPYPRAPEAALSPEVGDDNEDKPEGPMAESLKKLGRKR